MNFGRLLSITIFSAGLLPLSMIATLGAVHEPPRRGVFIVSDSIGIGWGRAMDDLIGHEIGVERIPENAEDSGYTADNIQHWTTGKRPRVILWNNGLHDFRTDTSQNGKPRTPLDRYADNLRRTAKHLRGLGCDVFFLTTTPVDEWNARGMCPSDVNSYNEVAIRVMFDENIRVIDINSLVTHSNLGRTDGIHYARDGYRSMAQHIAVLAGLSDI